MRQESFASRPLVDAELAGVRRFFLRAIRGDVEVADPVLSALVLRAENDQVSRSIDRVPTSKRGPPHPHRLP